MSMSKEFMSNQLQYSFVNTNLKIAFPDLIIIR